MSTCCMRKKTEEENTVAEKQGIVTILGSNHNVTATSLRRTLSADMSSKKWLSQNGFSHSHTAKLTDSSSSSEGEDDSEEEMKLKKFQIWDTIHKEKENAERFDMWSTILSHKKETSKSTSTPYVHPLVRRSKSCLSEKSLQICTESLGSETGSDGFSSYPQSESAYSDSDDEEEVIKLTINETIGVEECQQGKDTDTCVKKPLPRCFPPPLPSLHMRAHRNNGRLLLQAVSSHNNFCAQREDGRLVLSFANKEVGEGEEELLSFANKEIGEEEEEIEEVEGEIEQESMVCTSLNRLMMNKPIELVNTDMSPKWCEKFNNGTNFKDVNVVKHSTLPPRPRTRLIPSSKAFNAYEYYWRTKPATKAGRFTQLENNSSQTSSDGQQLLVLRGKNDDYSVHNLKNCKDSRRSFLFWEPYCIAT